MLDIRPVLSDPVYLTRIDRAEQAAYQRAHSKKSYLARILVCSGITFSTSTLISLVGRLSLNASAKTIAITSLFGAAVGFYIALKKEEHIVIQINQSIQRIKQQEEEEA